jgi:predicted RNase H-like HicB family nuclease
MNKKNIKNFIILLLIEKFEVIMFDTKLTMIYWKNERFWLGKLLEFPEIMTQGETPEELEENIREAFYLMNMDDVPQNRMLKEICV